MAQKDELTEVSRILLASHGGEFGTERNADKGRDSRTQASEQ
ncbi:hypothetical protein QPK87_17105 [Kamptonema cortianum]|uniref:Uncharacterized protein n=1 Tax=Geitlerinema calcuttense NRMC-F 0142 TaxID=2922238 RepID=A0ABT7LWZ7_9CYAN|nr:hypothetical protein [Geitlerinema calcuttense]MDI9640203.1 hypothetical protein [Geitlerinema splendidum]MDK3158273.1 hypothetical protein [Kamptonema cortianum]MDL5056533.1 hypothetical protein [Geitlerinema calcuttense NRMC-F 0142]